MPTDLSILIDLSAADHAARPLLASLDAQTLPATRWETVVAAPPAGDPRRDLLDRIAAARTNLLVVDADDRPISSAAGAAAAGRVLVLDVDDRLRPEALERLARTHGDVVLISGEVGPGAPRARGPLAADAEQVAVTALPADAAGLRMIAPRDAVYAARAEARDDLAQQVLARAGSVAVLASTPIVEVQDEPAEPAAWEGDEPLATATDATWSDGVLRLSVTLEPVAGDVDDAVLSLRHTGEHDELRLATDRAQTGGRLVLTAELDLRDGAPTTVRAGGWAVHSTLWRGEQRSRRRVPVPTSAGTALVDGRLVVLRAGKRDRLRIEVGSLTGSVLRAADPSRARVEESARGTHLALPVPTVHVHGTSSVTGLLHLGGLPVAATLEPEDGGVVLHAWLSGLPGQVPLSTRFGTPRAVPSGLLLDVANDGAMRLVRAPAASSTGTTASRPARPARPEQVDRALDRLPPEVRAGLGRARRTAARLSRTLADRLGG